jgi:DnaK suppressor protein
MPMGSKNRSNHKKHAELEAVLREKQESLKTRVAARLGDVTIETEPDDDAGLATSSCATDLAVSTLERERRELRDVELALEKMRTGEYGICENCENPIRDVRLHALPWARLCINCANNTTVAVAAD